MLRGIHLLGLKPTNMKILYIHHSINHHLAGLKVELGVNLVIMIIVVIVDVDGQIIVYI